MEMIEILKIKKNISWNFDKTFLCVIDKKEKIKKSYNFCNGLFTLSDKDSITIFIYDEILCSGKWIFFASIIDNDTEQESVHIVEGFKPGKYKGKEEILHKEQLSSMGCGTSLFVDKNEHKNRLNICENCEFYENKNFNCKINNNPIINFTFRSENFCPEKKWSAKEHNIKNNLKNQDDFELELEEYLKGI